jgi:hypothetical protein
MPTGSLAHLELGDRCAGGFAAAANGVRVHKLWHGREFGLLLGSEICRRRECLLLCCSNVLLNPSSGCQLLCSDGINRRLRMHRRP